MEVVRDLSSSDGTLIQDLEYEMKRERDELQNKLMKSANEDSFLSPECRKYREDLDDIEKQLDFYRQLKIKDRDPELSNELFNKNTSTAPIEEEEHDGIDHFEKHLNSLTSTLENTNHKKYATDKITSSINKKFFSPEEFKKDEKDVTSRMIKKQNDLVLEQEKERLRIHRQNQMNSLLLKKTLERESLIKEMRIENEKETREMCRDLNNTLTTETQDAIAALEVELSTNQEEIAEKLRKDAVNKIAKIGRAHV